MFRIVGRPLDIACTSPVLLLAGAVSCSDTPVDAVSTRRPLTASATATVSAVTFADSLDWPTEADFRFLSQAFAEFAGFS